jgi:hypothetical protein
MSRSKKSLENYFLIPLIFFMTVANGYTTIIGAQEIFPVKEFGVVFGFGAQLLLFLLLANVILKNAPLRKWLLIIAIAMFSIYTSCFAYYNVLAGSSNIQKAYDKALAAHQILSSTVYAPLKAQLETVKSEKNNADYQMKKEVRGEGVTLQKNFGEEAQRYAKESVKADAKIAKLKVIETLKELFEYETKDLKPADILERDRKALTAVPPSLLPIDRKATELIKREDYIEDIYDVKLFLPIARIQQGDQVANKSLFFASLVDIGMVFLSTAVDAKKGRPFKKAALSISYLVHDFKGMTKTVIKAVEQEVEPFTWDPTSLENEEMSQGIEYVRIRLQGSCTEFLQLFRASIDRKTLVIDLDSLDGNRNETFRAGFSVLIDALCSSRRMWCELDVDSGNFTLVKERFEAFREWIDGEMLIQAENERKLSRKPKFQQAVRNVTMGMPSLI